MRDHGFDGARRARGGVGVGRQHRPGAGGRTASAFVEARDAAPKRAEAGGGAAQRRRRSGSTAARAAGRRQGRSRRTRAAAARWSRRCCATSVSCSPARTSARSRTPICSRCSRGCCRRSTPTARSRVFGGRSCAAGARSQRQPEDRRGLAGVSDLRYDSGTLQPELYEMRGRGSLHKGLCMRPGPAARSSASSSRRRPHLHLSPPRIRSRRGRRRGGGVRPGVRGAGDRRHARRDRRLARSRARRGAGRTRRPWPIRPRRSCAARRHEDVRHAAEAPAARAGGAPHLPDEDPGARPGDEADAGRAAVRRLAADLLLHRRRPRRLPRAGARSRGALPDAHRDAADRRSRRGADARRLRLLRPAALLHDVAADVRAGLDQDGEAAEPEPQSVEAVGDVRPAEVLPALRAAERARAWSTAAAATKAAADRAATRRVRCG